MNAAQTLQLQDYTDKLGMLDDGELIEAWHQASEDHKVASAGEKDLRLAMKLSAEAEAIIRFGLGEHAKRLNQRSAQ